MVEYFENHFTSIALCIQKWLKLADEMYRYSAELHLKRMQYFNGVSQPSNAILEYTTGR